MTDVACSLNDLKKEVVEARNQAIKTDNQVKNIALDIKGFEGRFGSLERRAKATSLGIHLIVALVIAGAAGVVLQVRLGIERKEAKQRSALAQKREAQLQSRLAVAGKTLRGHEAARKEHQSSHDAVMVLLDHLEAGREREAGAQLGAIKLGALSPLERKLTGVRIADLKRRTAQVAYRSARSALGNGQLDQAVVDFERCFKIDPGGSYAAKARYLQVTTLYQLKRYDQAEPILRSMYEEDSTSALSEEIRFLLGTSLARLGKKEEAKKLLTVASADGRYQNAARLYLSALETGGSLPGTKKRAATRPKPPVATASP